MELYGGNPPHFHLNGMLGTRIHEVWIIEARHYYYRGIQALMLLSQAFQNETLATELLGLRNSFEKKTNLKPTGDTAKKLRDLKKGRRALTSGSTRTPNSGAPPSRHCLPPPPVIHSVHLASLREPRLEEFPVGGGRNKLKVRLRIRNLAALPVLAISGHSVTP